MSLVAWYPLNGDLNDYSGNDNHLTYLYNNGKLIQGNGKIGGCYERQVLNDGSDVFRSTNKIDLSNRSFTMMCWAYVSDTHHDTANGLVTNHVYSTNSGAGITIKSLVDDSDYRICCNTGNGTSRTFNSYYGTSNIRNVWAHLTMRYDAKLEQFKLFVNGIIEKTQDYAMVSYEEYLEIFAWSVGYTANSYRPASKLNDVRIYDHAVSNKEIIEIAKAKVLHYTFNDFQEPTTNVLPTYIDPSFESYTIGGATPFYNDLGTGSILIISSDMVRSGTKSVKSVVGTGGNDRFYKTSLNTVYAGETWTASVWMYAEVAGAKLRLFYHGGDYSWSSTDATHTGTGWEKLVATRPAATSDTQNHIMFYHNGTPTLYIDELQLEKKNHATQFINGSRTGIVRDVSRYSNDSLALTESTTPQWTEDSKLGNGAYYFNGVADYIQVSKLGTTLSLAEFTNCTLTFWRKNDTSITNWLPFVGQDGSYYIMATSGGTGTFYHNNAGSSLTIYKDGVNSGTSVTPFTDQLWHHYAVKGVDLTTWTRIKLSGYGGVWNCEGTFDDIRLYNTPLSDNDIAEIANVKVQLDNTGNLFLNEIVTNGIKADTRNLIHYEYLANGIFTTGQTWSSDITSQYITYGAHSNYRLIQTPQVNPVGDIDIMQTHICDVTFYSTNFSTQSHFYFNNVDNTKTYRFSQWIYLHKEPGTGTNQKNYLGIQGNTVCDVNTTTPKSNPYFTYPAMNDTKYMDKWVLQVYYVYPYASTGNVTSGTLYYLDGSSVASGGNYTWNTGYTSSHIRQYYMYQYAENQAGSYVSVYRPRMEIVDGNEPTIEELINCSVHRVLVDDSGDPTYGFKSIDSNGVGKFDDLSEVGITDGLVGYWKLDGDAKDYSGKGNDGVVTGATPSSGWKNGAYNFEYTTDKIEIGSIGGLTDEFAISCIFNSNTITNDQNMVSRNGPYFLGIRSSKLWGGVYAGATWAWLNGSTTLLSDTWYFACLTYDGVNAKIYLNALLEDTEPQTGTVISNGALRFGYTTGGADEPMDGKIGDVRLYNRVPTIEEIITQYKYCLPTTGMQLSDMGTLYVNKEIIEGL